MVINQRLCRLKQSTALNALLADTVTAFIYNTIKKDIKMINFHSIKLTYLGATNTKGARVKLTSTRFDQSVTLSCDYKCNGLQDQAVKWLTANGFEVVGTCEGGDIVLTSTFKPLK